MSAITSHPFIILIKKCNNINAHGGAVAYLGFCEGGAEPMMRGSRHRRRQWGGVWGGGVSSPLFLKMNLSAWFNTVHLPSTVKTFLSKQSYSDIILVLVLLLTSSS